MKQPPKQIRCIACSIFKNIIETCFDDEPVSVDLEFVTSMLHMKPELLNNILSEKLRSHRPGERVLLIYGDCHPYMHEMEKSGRVYRIEGCNCIEIMLRKEQYNKLLKEGAFFLMPDWTFRWQEVFKIELGLSELVSKDFFREMHTKLVYLDTQQIPVPENILKEVSDFTGLPYEIVRVDRSIISDKIKKLLKSLENETE